MKNLAHAKEPKARPDTIRCEEYGHRPGSGKCLRTQRNGGKKVCVKCSHDTTAK